MLTRRLHLGPIVGAALLLIAAGCADGSDTDPTGSSTPGGPETSAPSLDDSTPPEECPAVIGARVVESLGWSGESPAVKGRGGCLWTGEEGTVVVVERAETYNDECERLIDVAPPTTFRSDVAPDIRGCGYVRDDGLGLSEWVVDVDGRVISLSVAVLTAVDPEQVRSALLQLTATAANVS